MGSRTCACYCVSCLLILIGGMVCLIIYLGVVPYQRMKFHVNDASLTEFYLTNDDILHYNLAVNISVRNSNKIERISYRYIRSSIICYGKGSAALSYLPSFQQGTENTTLLHSVIQGQTLFKLRGSHLKDFNHDQRDGRYKIHVVLYLTITMKHAGGGSYKGCFKLTCGLFRLHLLGSSSSLNNKTGIEGLFHTKRCKLSGDDREYRHQADPDCQSD
ncbi:hypothetical protein MKW94_030721 [Papaver nudicaule]|uniref:Late embryogenesis abundant protein LEA-2 subgroup domain-containing protein n=1 Tax=Papaver nudicaule TaxID=74823 RepID=A0AA41VLM5_PAPNU|nr:hypothetical protein [Papaver nudicaule]